VRRTGRFESKKPETVQRKLFELLNALLKGEEDGILACPTVVVLGLTKQFYREGSKANIAEPRESFVWKYIEHPEEAEKEECRRRCQEEKKNMEDWSFGFVDAAFKQKCKFITEPTEKWEEEFAALRGEIDRFVPLIIEPLSTIVEKELMEGVKDAPDGRLSDGDRASFAEKRKALELVWWKIPLLCSHSVCWLRFAYEVLKTEEQPVRSEKWRKMATDLLQGIHLVHVGCFVSNDRKQRKFLQEVACGISQLCPGVGIAKVMDPAEFVNLVWCNGGPVE
jgi:hypothetical protein